MKKISLLVLFYGIFISLLQADLIHNFDNQRFDGNRYEELGSQSGNLQNFTVIIRLESDIIKNGLYAWALRCDDAHYTLRTDNELDRFVSLANQIEKSVNSGNFYPNEPGFSCGECPYADRCKKWR